MQKWNDFWMKVAEQAATLSKDPNTQVGAVIVSKDNRQCSIGYNGFPAGVHEDLVKWQRPIKYQWVVHAEENAIINAPFDTKGCKIYCTLEPCHKCMGRLVNAGIEEVYYKDYYTRTQEDKHLLDIWHEIEKRFKKVERICCYNKKEK